MIKKYFNLIVLLVLTVNLCGQQTIFYDSEWKETKANKATFYRIDSKTKGGFVRTDYFASNKRPFMTGQYLSLYPEIKTGEFNWYYENGRLKHKGEYLDNKEIGTHKWYYDNGQLEAIENYSMGRLEGDYKEYYRNGTLKYYGEYSDNMKIGTHKWYYENGQLEAVENYSMGRLDGDY